MTLVVEEYKEDPLSFITPVEEKNSAIFEEKDSLSSDYVVVEQERANAIATNDEEDVRANQDGEIEGEAHRCCLSFLKVPQLYDPLISLILFCRF